MALPLALGIGALGLAGGAGVMGILSARQQKRALSREARRAEEAQAALHAQWEAAMAEYRRQAEQARRANVERAAGIADEYMKARTRGLRDVAETGIGERLDIRNESRRRGGALGQQLVSRGISGTTAGAVLSRGVDRERAQMLASQRGNEAQRRASVDQGLTGQLLGMLERIQQPMPQAPDHAAYLQAMQQLGMNAGAARGASSGMMTRAFADALGGMAQMIPIFGQMGGLFGGGGGASSMAQTGAAGGGGMNPAFNNPFPPM